LGVLASPAVLAVITYQGRWRALAGSEFNGAGCIWGGTKNMSAQYSAANDEAAHDRPHGITRWLLSTNHKDIGSLYLTFALVGSLVSGFMSIAMRMELQSPGMQIFADPHTFNVFVTGHGLIMVFFMIMPSLFGGFGNWFVPLMIGAATWRFRASTTSRFGCCRWR
jgi:Cytochrome C and Quinol oxidase polypeptide I